MPRSNSNSNSNSNVNTNSHNSANNSSNVSRSRSPYGDAVSHPHSLRNEPSQEDRLGQRVDPTRQQERHPDLRAMDLDRPAEMSRPATPAFVYIVTSNFASQTTRDGVRLSESEIIGFQILAVFARVEDANSYAEHECEEIDAGVRRRRRRTQQGGAVGIQDGEGIRAEAIMSNDGTVSWTVESAGQIEVRQWVVQ